MGVVEKRLLHQTPTTSARKGLEKMMKKKLNYVIKDYERKEHSIYGRRYRTFEEFLDATGVRGNDLSDLLDPNTSLQEDVSILIDDLYMTENEIENEVLDILKKADEYTIKRYAETYYTDDVCLDCEVSDAFEWIDTIDEFVLDDESLEHAEEGDIKSFKINCICLELKIFKRFKRELETRELVDANETTIDDDIVYEERPTQYVNVYYYDDVEEVSKNDLD